MKTLNPDIELHLFGSSCNGFAFRRSDLDISMTFSDVDKSEVRVSYILFCVIKLFFITSCVFTMLV